MAELTEEQKIVKAAEEAAAKLKAEVEAAAKKIGKFRALRNVRHDNKDYPAGSLIENMTNAQAAPLLSTRTVEVATKEVPL